MFEISFMFLTIQDILNIYHISLTILTNTIVRKEAVDLTDIPNLCTLFKQKSDSKRKNYLSHYFESCGLQCNLYYGILCKIQSDLSPSLSNHECLFSRSYHRAKAKEPKIEWNQEVKSYSTK